MTFLCKLGQYAIQSEVQPYSACDELMHSHCPPLIIEVDFKISAMLFKV